VADADRVSAELAVIRERFDSLAARYPLAEMAAPDRDGLKAHSGHIATSVLDVPRLLAAVEAVLELAGKLAERHGTDSALDEDRMWIRQECGEQIRAAIERALNGEDQK